MYVIKCSLHGLDSLHLENVVGVARNCPLQHLRCTNVRRALITASSDATTA
jgi:hypothetical protein